MFYSIAGDKLLEAVAVCRPDFILEERCCGDFNYPKEGWHWFATREEAVNALGLPVLGA